MQKINIVHPKYPIFEEGKVNIWDFIFEKNPNLILSMDSHSMSNSTRIYARSCSFLEIDKSTAISFLNQNHIKGAFNHQYGFGLFYENELVAVMTFSKCRYNNNFDWEIIRYACLQTFTVVGGAGKLLAGAINKLGSNSIFSYSENMIGVGNLYTKLGFQYLGETGPGFFWYKDGEVINRQMAAKYNLIKMFPDEVEAIQKSSISAFMKNKGYIQVFDMGNKRWGMNPREKIEKIIDKNDFVFIEENGEIVCVSELEATNENKINVRKIQCREMIKNDQVKLIPNSLVSDFLADGWEFNTKIPGNAGMVKIKKADDTMFIRLDELPIYESQGWRAVHDKNRVKKFTRAPATAGKIAVKKDGIKKMVCIDDAYNMVKNEGWELGAASCWRLASDTVKDLGRSLGYDVENNQTKLHK